MFSQIADGPLPVLVERPVIGLDVGGTKIAGGVVTEGALCRRIVMPTPREEHQERVVDALCEVVAELRLSHPDVAAIGVGAAGMVEWPQGRIRWAPNNVYRELDLREVLVEATGLPVVVDNDGNAMAWGEYRLGVGKGTPLRDVVCLTIGTGVGGGIILDGKMYRGRTGIGAEVGHIVVDPNSGARCGCGSVGCLEALASGTALERLGREAVCWEPEGALAEISRTNGPLTGAAVSACALSGDPTAIALLARIGYWLGIGIANLVNLFEPEVVVVGGGLGGTGNKLLFGPARSTFESYLFGRRHRRDVPSIVPALLGADAGLMGAAAIALEEATSQAFE